MQCRPVDLALPAEKTPWSLSDYQFASPRTVQDLVGTHYAIGSSLPEVKIYHREDLGLFECVHEAWKNHWNLRTSPEDWWSHVATRVAKAIDKAAKEGNEKVRKHFVDHEGKENICVDVDVNTIYEVDHEWFFSAVSSEIQKKIKVPEYARVMQNDFSTSSPTHHISSQINLMASMQEFFNYEMGLFGCGIKGVEMMGEQKDWDQLVVKLNELKAQLEPIESYIGYRLGTGWFDHVEHVFRMLAKTYGANDSNSRDEIASFWADILMIGKGWKYGPSGIGGHEAEEYNGWLVQFLIGYPSVLKQNFFSQSNKDKLSGLNSVPLKITLKYKRPPISDESKLMAGIMGFELHRDSFNEAPSLQPHHMWAMELNPNSPIRRARPC